MSNRTSHDPYARTEAPATLADKAAKLDLSPSQLLGGALAAMTAAALGSRLGVAGTITGAAVASLIAGVATSLYTASLRHTRARVQTALGRGTETPSGSVRIDPETEQPMARPSVAARSGRKLPWKGVLAAAMATFALALVAVTGFEALAGTALSGGNGTTIEQVAKPNKPAAGSDDDAKEDKSTATPSESTDSETTESADPSETPATEPPAGEQPVETEAPAETEAPPEDEAPAETEAPTEPRQEPQQNERDPGADEPKSGATPNGG
ncbi:MAG TPA: hypothetical protein VF635_14385 [Propionibacteriaceae bacterium]|jgi:hypothetical protein